MATKSIGPVVVALLTNNSPTSDDVTDLIDDRVCKEGGTLEDEALPYVTYTVDSNLANRDLDGIDDYEADVTITATSLDYDECDELARAIATALTDVRGTHASVVVRSSTDPEVSDTPNGPIDIDGAEVFQSDITVTLTYA